MLKYYILLTVIFGCFDIVSLFRNPLQTTSCATPRLDHGRVRMKQRGKLVKFVCLPGFELVGNRYATCRNEKWDAPTPVCVRPGCSVPSIQNGIHSLHNNGAWVMYFCLPGYKILGTTIIFCDGVRFNALPPTCVDTNAPPKLSCDFEDSSLCGWKQDELHDFDWLRLNKETPTNILFTGPSYDHTFGEGKDGYYMYIESTNQKESDTARLLSPVYNSSYAVDGCFSFYYHMFGSQIGGLRVYQKPEAVDFQSLSRMDTIEKQKYVLFEMWGDKGDVWYNSITNLKDFSDAFQIIIEGIRGHGITSDIAIDDVAILQGEDCSSALSSAVTPSPSYTPESCAGRCTDGPSSTANQSCECFFGCSDTSTCCPDIYEQCLFNSDNFPELEIPYTQKFILTTPDSPTTDAAETTTSSTTTTTSKPPTTSTTTTTPTTPKSTTTKPTTPKPTQKTSQKLTTINMTTVILTQSTVKPTTIKVTPTTIKVTPTTITTTTKITKITTAIPYGVSRTIDNHNIYHDLVEKAKKEQQIETKKIGNGQVKKPKSSTWKIILILAIIGSCVTSIIWLNMYVRSSRGRVLMAKIRGTATNDPEVRYLSNDENDDLL